ncbi:MAG: BNR/Asp-box repeat protein [Bacteroidetes bacterium]|jgi:hypothetical protein|nr:BNR/Asp-box repeat protein [Bacteroidota bacterium]
MTTQFICLALVIVLLCPCVPAQWVQTTGPGGGNIGAIAVSGTNVFVGTGFPFFGVHNAGGVFRTTDDGASWTAANSGLTDMCIGSLTVSPASDGAGGVNLFAGTLCGGVLRSTDNGTSWTATSLTSAFVTSFAVSGTNLFAGSPGPT